MNTVQQINHERAQSAVEIRVFWNDALMDVVQFDIRPAKLIRFRIGETPICDYPVSKEAIGGNDEIPLLRSNSRGEVFVQPSDGQWGSMIELSSAREDPFNLEIGPNRFSIERIVPEANCARIQPPDRVKVLFIAGSFVLHAAVFAWLWSFPPLSDRQKFDYLAEHNRYFEIMMTPHRETETLRLPASSPSSPTASPNLGAPTASPNIRSGHTHNCLRSKSVQKKSKAQRAAPLGKAPSRSKTTIKYGIRGLGLKGAGRGGGGTGEGTIGLGHLHTIGHGAGGGSGSGYGRGAGGLSGRGKRHFDDPRLVYWPGHNTELYDTIDDNPFREVAVRPLSTFSIDVDTAAYSNVRRFINNRSVPPKDAVRIEEMINYFSYDYEVPRSNDKPLVANVETAHCPWNPDHLLTRIGLKGFDIPKTRRPPANLVFLVDVSGSMSPFNKLPLLKQSLHKLVHQLNERDRVAMVVYAGASGLVLDSTPCSRKSEILRGLDRLEAGGSTNGGAGIELAYSTARRHFIDGGINRVILATDGDFNVGTTNAGELVDLIRQKSEGGIFLSVLGFGMGNYKDAMLEKLADKGNGNFAYIDTIKEAHKVLVEQLGSTLVTIAKDVKIQVEFNPLKVGAYRLIGYENRLLKARDFNDDKKDAGEIGAGHTVTALYELVPPDKVANLNQKVVALRYQKSAPISAAATSDELFLLKLRYKPVDDKKSKLIVYRVRDSKASIGIASHDFKFAAAVAGFGMILRQSDHARGTTLAQVLALAKAGRGADEHGYRREFIELVQKAQRLSL